jgi:hypothetical protein
LNRPNWRDAGAYGRLQSLDAPGFAWEFLKRNPSFVAELESLKVTSKRRKLTPSELEQFSLRWGVRIRGAQRSCEQPGRSLDAHRAAQHTGHHGLSGSAV